MLTTFALTVIASQAKLVSLHLPVSHSSVVVSELAKQTGERLAVSGAVQDDFLYVNVTGVPGELLKSRLALLLNAKWTTSNGISTLTAPEPVPIATDAGYRASISTWIAGLKVERRLTIEQILDKYKELLPKVGPNAPAVDAELRKLERTGPAYDLLTKVIVLMEKELGEIQDRERIIWSLTPNKYQKQLPQKFLELQKEYQTSYERAHELALQSGLFDQTGNRVYTALEDLKLPTAYDSFYMTAERTGTFLRVALRPMTVQQVGFSSGYFGRQSNDLNPVQSVSTPNPFKDIKGDYELPPDQRLLNDYFYASATGVQSEDRAGEAEVKEYLNLAKNDPLKGEVTKLIDSYASEVKKNIIGVVPDQAASLPFNFFFKNGGKLTRSEVLFSVFSEQRFTGAGPTFFEQDGLLSIVPSSLDASRRARFPRKEMTTLLAQALTEKRLDLDRLADVVRAGKYDEVTTNIGSFVSLATRKLAAIPTLDDLQVLKLYAEFDPSVRQRIKSEGAILSWNSMSQRQKDIVNRFLYKSASAVQSRRAIDFSRETNVWERGKLSFNNYEPANLSQEPTFLLGEGLPLDAKLFFQLESYDSVLLLREINGRQITMPAMLSTISYEYARREKANDSQDPFTFALNSTKLLRLSIDLGEKGVLYRAYKLEDLDPNPKALTRKQLPQAFQDALDKEIAKTKREMGGGG